MNSQTIKEKDTIYSETPIEVGSIECFEAGQSQSPDDIDLFHEAKNYSPEEIEALDKKLLRRTDMYLIPILCITYLLQFLDKLSLNYASAYTLKQDLGLQGQRFSWVAAIFNFGYLFWALPSNIIIQKVPVAKYTGAMIICWAALLLGHVGAKNYGGILVLRFLLGMFEACISPSCMMICSMFYTKKEQPLRMCIFLSCNGVATMVGALLGYGLGHAKSHVLKEWQLIFLFIGLLNLVWGVVFLFIAPDSPATARFLTREERALVVNRVSVNMMGIKNPKFNKSQALEAVLDIKVHALSLIGLGCGIINGGVSNFASSLIKGFGFSGLNATLLQLPTGAIEFVVLVAAGFLAIRFKNIRCYILMGLTIPPLAGLIGIRQISLDHKWALVGCTWLQFIVGGPVILCWVLMTANIAGHTKRSIMNGWWFTLYAAGNIIGSNIFFAKEAPRYYSAMTGLIACYIGMFLLGGVLKYYMTWDNKKRDLENEDSEEAREKAILAGFNDLTDKQNRGFRYSL